MAMHREGSPRKLRDDTWGAAIQGEANVGDSVTVRSKGGKSWPSIVTEVVFKGAGFTIVRTRDLKKGETLAPAAKEAPQASDPFDPFGGDEPSF